MNSENFPEFLADPSGLYKVSYQELQSLVLEYPYAANLWKLLLCKAYFEDKSDFPKILESLAIRVQDRRKLKAYMAVLSDLKLEYNLAIETRQILDLEKLKEKAIERAMSHPISSEQEEKELEAPKPQQTDRKNLLEELFNEDTDTEDDPDQESKVIEETESKEEIKGINPEFYKASEDVLINVIIGNIISNTFNFHREGVHVLVNKQNKALEKAKNSPTPKQAFKSWGKSQKPNKKKKKKKKSSKSKSIAAKSIMYNTSIASETLANILEQQGYFDKAIKMYEQLCLKNPEKIALFEAKINNLKERR